MSPEEIENFALANGHPPVAEGVILVDFDQTIRAWGGLFDMTEPYAGAHEFLWELHDAGYRLYLFTSRLSTVWHAHEGRNPTEGIMRQVEFLQEYCDKYKLPFEAMTAEKIPSIAIIDDKAVEFRGDWKKARRRFRMLVPRAVRA
jgi:hypothetical protein